MKAHNLSDWEWDLVKRWRRVKQKVRAAKERVGYTHRIEIDVCMKNDKGNVSESIRVVENPND